MIEGKLGHHFQVGEMRHIASPACPAFTGCWRAERRCSSCAAGPTCPAFPADKRTFWLKLLSARTGSSACPVYVVHEGVGKELTLIWQHLLQLIWVASLHCWVQMLSAERAPPANSHRLGECPLQREHLGWEQHRLLSHCPTFHRWQTMHKIPLFSRVWPGGHQSQTPSKGIQQVSSTVRHVLQVQHFGGSFLKCANAQRHCWTRAADWQQAWACLQSSL